MKWIIIIVFPLSVYAQSFKPETTKIKIGSDEFFISKGCKDCDALKAIKSLDPKMIEQVSKSTFGGRSVGDEICRHVFSAGIEYSKDSEGNESHYCQFKDGSYTPTAHLIPRE